MPISALNIIIGLIGFSGAVGAAVGFFKVGLVKTQLEGLRGDRDDQAARIDRLQEQIAEQATKMQEQSNRIDSLTAENKQLQQYVSGAEAVAKLAEILAATDLARQAEHHDIQASILTLPTILAAWHEELRTLMADVRRATHSHEVMS